MSVPPTPPPRPAPHLASTQPTPGCRPMFPGLPVELPHSWNERAALGGPKAGFTEAMSAFWSRRLGEAHPSPLGGRRGFPHRPPSKLLKPKEASSGARRGCLLASPGAPSPSSERRKRLTFFPGHVAFPGVTASRAFQPRRGGASQKLLSPVSALAPASPGGIPASSDRPLGPG